MIELPPASTIRPLDETVCQHLQHMPMFDETAARGLNYTEIRRLWPRFFGKCSNCDKDVIMYASYAHYIYGDW